MAEEQFEVGEGGSQLVGWRTGAGPAVLLLHGGPGLTDYTRSLGPELADAYRLVGYQQRGLAPSSTEGPFDVETQAEDALRVMEAAELERPLLLGHSWGGHLAMFLAAWHPERFSAALIVDPLGAIPDGGAADLDRNLRSKVSPEAAARAGEIDERAMRGEASDEEQTESLRIFWPGYFADPDKAPPMPELRVSVPTYSETLASVEEHFQKGTLVSLLPSSPLPALFLLGGRSPIPNRFGAESAALMPRARVQVLPASGHMPWMETRGLVRAALDSLLQETRGSLQPPTSA